MRSRHGKIFGIIINGICPEIDIPAESMQLAGGLFETFKKVLIIEKYYISVFFP
jgi:hypothetical protein